MNSSEVCSVCTGDNMPNCICGGTGTAFGETQGLREECFRLRDEIEKYQRAIDKQKDRCKALKTIASDLKDALVRAEALPEAWQSHQSDAAKDFWNWETTIEPKSVEDCINELKAALRY